MNEQEKIDYWIELAEYDLKSAEIMFRNKMFLYVGFMCHQAIEKMFKALYVKTLKELPPKTHNLGNLVKKIGIESTLTDDITDIIDKLNPLNIEARYPTYKDELFKLLTEEYCSQLMKDTGVIFQWIKTKL